MNNTDWKSFLILPLVLLVALGVAWAAGQGGAAAFGLPIFAICVGLAFLIQWIAFIPAYLFQTEAFYDLTGSITYISVILLAVLMSPVIDGRSIVLASLVGIWALRLGTFLFRRILKAGKDSRFDQIKPSFIRFLNAWTIQGLWVSLTLAAALAAITSSTRKDLGFVSILGILIWVLGFTIEVVADLQKSRFKGDPANEGNFINSGLWSRSRHPNYFGEIVLWIGVALIALPVLRGWQLVSLISPVFVAFLLTKVSGIPPLEKKADERWGGQTDYEAYKENTPVLIPRL